VNPQNLHEWACSKIRVHKKYFVLFPIDSAFSLPLECAVQASLLLSA
jgi:hypothetical protein